MEQDNGQKDVQDKLVVMTDDDGNETFFYEQQQLECDGQKYAVLIDLGSNDEPRTEEELAEADQIIAKIIYNEAEGIDEYSAPEDDEFEKVSLLLDSLVDSDEE